MSRSFNASSSLSSLSLSLSLAGCALSALLTGCGDGESTALYAAPDVSAADAAAGATAADTSDAADDAADAGGQGGQSPTPGAGGAPDPGAGNPGGAGGDNGGTAPAPVDPDALRFDNVECTHTLAGLTSVIEGQSASCSFDVLGKAGELVLLSCEDTQGKAIDCDVNSTVRSVYPDDEQPVPLEFAGFWHNTEKLGGTTISIVLVAKSATETARHRLDVPIEQDDGKPDAPTLSVDCGQAPGATTIEIEAGQNLDCTGTVIDLDPEMIEYSIELASVAGPEWLPIPASGAFVGTGFFGWTFFARAADVGKSFDYTFKVTDYTHAPVTTTVTVVVK